MLGCVLTLALLVSKANFLLLELFLNEFVLNLNHFPLILFHHLLLPQKHLFLVLLLGPTDFVLMLDNLGVEGCHPLLLPLRLLVNFLECVFINGCGIGCVAEG